MSERYRLIFLLLVVVTAIFTFVNSVFFLITDIIFIGNRTLTAEELLEIAGIGERANFFRIDEDLIAERLRAYPLIREARVEKIFPSSLRIEVKERVPVAVLPKEGYFVEVDEEGVAIAFIDRIAEDSLPIITGIDTSALVLGSNVGNPGLVGALHIIKNLREDVRRELSEVNLTNPADIRIYTLDGLKIYVGQAEDLVKKVRLLESLLLNLRERGVKAEYIDVRYVNTPVVK